MKMKYEVELSKGKYNHQFINFCVLDLTGIKFIDILIITKNFVSALCTTKSFKDLKSFEFCTTKTFKGLKSCMKNLPPVRAF